MLNALSCIWKGLRIKIGRNIPADFEAQYEMNEIDMSGRARVRKKVGQVYLNN